VEANIRIDPKAVEEVIGLMGNLLEAWEQVVAGDPPSAAASTGGQSLALTG
jgi:flagellin-specific chaperone FliS